MYTCSHVSTTLNPGWLIRHVKNDWTTVTALCVCVFSTSVTKEAYRGHIKSNSLTTSPSGLTNFSHTFVPKGPHILVVITHINKLTSVDQTSPKSPPDSVSLLLVLLFDWPSERSICMSVRGVMGCHRRPDPSVAVANVQAFL